MCTCNAELCNKKIQIVECERWKKSWTFEMQYKYFKIKLQISSVAVWNFTLFSHSCWFNFVECKHTNRMQTTMSWRMSTLLLQMQLHFAMPTFFSKGKKLLKVIYTHFSFHRYKRRFWNFSANASTFTIKTSERHSATKITTRKCTA